MAISSASRNRVLAELLRNLHEKQARFWFLSLSDPQHLKNVYDEHMRVLDALARRDVPAARQAIRVHLNEFRKNIIRTLWTITTHACIRSNFPLPAPASSRLHPAP